MPGPRPSSPQVKLPWWKRAIKVIGPGFITGASDDDPAGIATYAQTGAQFGYTQLWTAFFTTPLMSCVQEMCGRIGVVTSKGLAKVMKEHYPKQIVFLAVGALVVANVINLGADLGAMAAAIALVVPTPFWILLLGIAGITVGLEVF